MATQAHIFLVFSQGKATTQTRTKRTTDLVRKRQIKKQKKKANKTENGRSGGEENERQMTNNVMEEMRVYDGYLVGLM